METVPKEVIKSNDALIPSEENKSFPPVPYRSVALNQIVHKKSLARKPVNLEQIVANSSNHQNVTIQSTTGITENDLVKDSVNEAFADYNSKIKALTW